MWWKIVLLTIYLVILFLLSRILETMAYYEGGYLSSKLLDPVSLSVRKLKGLLDQRGVSHAGVIEKQELTELVEVSGGVTEGELESATLLSEETSAANFSCGAHFYEEVEDTKDSVWVVQVVPNELHSFIPKEDWRMFVKKISRFGVRTGIFDCSSDLKLCENKRWFTPRLVLALPQGLKAKDYVILKTYTGSTRVQAMFDWVSYNLASRVKEIQNMDELRQDWYEIDQKKKHPNVKMIFFSSMKLPPMFYSALNVKFTGRVKFGLVTSANPGGKNMLNKLAVEQVPLYQVITPEGNLTFGSGPGQYPNFRTMALYLRTLQPEVNDVFLFSLVVVNVISYFDIVVSRGNLFKRIGSLLWKIGKYNCFLILLWLPVLGMMKLPYIDQVLEHMLTLLRLISQTHLADRVRHDWLWYTSDHVHLLLITFLGFIAAAVYIFRWYKGPEQQSVTENNNSEWWNFNYMNYLFQPVVSLTQPMSANHPDIEVGMQLLIERLAVPNFWLQPMINVDYIKDLPVWRYEGKTVESDVGSDNDSLRMDSEGEDTGCMSDDGHSASRASSPERQPSYLFICEKCRALQQQAGENRPTEMTQEEALERESACAKLLMDGDYKCMCKGTAAHSSSHGRHESRRYERQAKSKPATPAAEPERKNDDAVLNAQMPCGMLPCTECVICLESYRYSAVLCGLPCGHSFHQNCIMGWLSRDNHCCPVCRWPPYKAKPCSMHLHLE